MKRARLVLADGTLFEGTTFGADAEVVGEVVFNTSMTGYQEILTDPSYVGQIVTMAYPHIGNVGTNPLDDESARPHAVGLAVREAGVASNWRSQSSLGAWLARFGVGAIEGFDTRRLVRHLRTHGAQMGVLTTDDAPTEALVARARAAPGMEGRDLATGISTRAAYQWSKGTPTGAQRAADAGGARALPRGGHRLRPQAGHAPVPGGRGVPGDRGAGLGDGRRGAGAGSRWRLPHQRPGRPGGGEGGRRGGGGAAGPGAGVRHLPGAPDPGAGAGRQDLQAQVRPPRRQPAGDGPLDRAGWRSPRRTTGSPSTPRR